MTEMKDLNGLSTDKLADIWLSHNATRWRVVTSAPLFSASILVGWYSLDLSGIAYFENAVLILGALGMFAHYVLIRRLAEYAGAYHDAIPHRPQVKTAWMGISASAMGNAVPLLLALVFAILLFADIPSEVPTSGGNDVP